MRSPGSTGRRPVVQEQVEVEVEARAETSQDLVDLLAEDTVGVPRQEIEAALADDGSLWDPLPLTLPTYVNKARARRTVRTIELTGINSSGHDQADTTLAREAAESTEAGHRPDRVRRAQGRRRLTRPPDSGWRRLGGNFSLALNGAWGCGAVGSASRSQ